MAEEQKKQPEQAPKAKRTQYFVVNPAGAVHEVTREHAEWRLSLAGWRMATEEEIERYRKTPVQRSDRPIAKPHSTSLPETEETD